MTKTRATGPEAASQGRQLFSVLRALGVMTVPFGLAAGLVLVADVNQYNSKLYYILFDLPGFVVLFATAFALAVLAPLPPVSKALNALALSCLPVWLVALCVLVASVLGVHAIYHGHPLTADEWMTRFQAEIFLSGGVSATLPEEWRDFGRALLHGFTSYDVATGVASSNYRPGMATLYAAFELFGLGVYTSAVLNAGAVLLVARVARQVFPDTPEAPAVAVLLIATSTQALAASMTSWAMTAHLFFNLLWLTLFLNNTLRSHVMAAFVGVITASLHQIHFHLFFALPFLLTLLRPLQMRLVLIYGTVYLIGHLGVLYWDEVSFNSAVAGASVAAPSAPEQGVAVAEAPGILDRVRSMAKLPNGADVGAVTTNLVRLIAWQSLALVPLLLFCRVQLREKRVLVLLIMSLAVSLLPYPFLMPDQGSGWGYRYFHGLIGNLVLLGVGGWVAVTSLAGRGPYRAWVTACLLISPFALIPFRAYQIESRVEPFARAAAYVSQLDADVVIVDVFRVGGAHDIVRNSAVALPRPVILNMFYLTPEQIRDLCGHYRVLAPAPQIFEDMGLVLFGPEPEYADRYARLQDTIGACHD